ncbi:MAG: ABC transporter ATP-binding protein [bacterium]|nr:ABC transporter ATP-binding protein [bacterium]
MIKLEGLSKSFGTIEALREVSFEIPASKITIIAGADGAGKSTLFKMMVGLIKKDGGGIVLRGENIGGDFEKIRGVTGYMPERFSLYPDLSVEENMNFFADIHKIPRRQREERKQSLLEKTGMMPFKKRRAGALSGGMKQKLALSTILLSAPELIILDEPTTGVDPLSRIEFFNIIEQLKEEGKTIVISTPYLDEAEQGDYIVFLKDGKVIGNDSISRIKKEFPARLFRILPKGNIFELMETLKQDEGLRDNVYLRGKYIKYLQTGESGLIDSIPHISVAEEEPRLEDIYIYYERLATGERV